MDGGLGKIPPPVQEPRKVFCILHGAHKTIWPVGIDHYIPPGRRTFLSYSLPVSDIQFGQHRRTIRHFGVALVICVFYFSTAPVQADNWLMLQGTEPKGSESGLRLWGFIQTEFQQTGGTRLKAGPWKDQETVFNQIRPDLETDSSFNIIRARFGVRGNLKGRDALTFPRPTQHTRS